MFSWKTMMQRVSLLLLLIASFVCTTACTEEQSFFSSAPPKRAAAAAAATKSGNTVNNVAFGIAGGGGSAGELSARTDLNWTWQEKCDQQRKNCTYLVCAAPEERCYPCVANRPGSSTPGPSQTAPWSNSDFTCSFDSWACPYVGSQCKGASTGTKYCRKVCRVCGC